MSAATAGTAQVLPFEGAPSSEPLEPRVRHLSRREQIWIIVEDSTIIGGFIFLVIVFSTVSFVLETEPSMKGVEMQGMWFGCASHPYGTAAATPFVLVTWQLRCCIRRVAPTPANSPCSRMPCAPRSTSRLPQL